MDFSIKISVMDTPLPSEGLMSVCVQGVLLEVGGEKSGGLLVSDNILAIQSVTLAHSGNLASTPPKRGKVTIVQISRGIILRGFVGPYTLWKTPKRILFRSE